MRPLSPRSSEVLILALTATPNRDHIAPQRVNEVSNTTTLRQFTPIGCIDILMTSPSINHERGIIISPPSWYLLAGECRVEKWHLALSASPHAIAPDIEGGADAGRIAEIIRVIETYRAD